MSRWTLLPFAIAALGPWTGCDVDSSAPPAFESARAVTGSSVDDTHTYVGAIVVAAAGDEPLDVLCSATLIDAQWALTSAGCLTNIDTDDLTNLQMCFDNAVSAEGCDGVAVDRVFVHPDYTGTPGASDAALLRLSPPTDLTPATYNTSALAGYVGAEISLVGYGAASTGTPEGVRRRGVTDISAIDLVAVYIDDPVVGPCGGDIGGAGLIDRGGSEVLGGIIAAGPEACAGIASLQRVDTIAPWIEQTLSDESACDLFVPTCPDRMACYPGIDDRSCFESDQIRIGGACDPDASTWVRLPCADGSVCLALPGSPDEGVCWPWCRTDTDCSGDDIALYCRQAFDELAVGACVPVDDDRDGAWLPDDCDDSRADVYPGATEVCGNGIDEDCSGDIDDHPDCEGGDTGLDAGSDAGSDVGPDVGADVGSDAGTDAADDVVADVEPDTDVGGDGPTPDDAAPDTSADLTPPEADDTDGGDGATGAEAAEPRRSSDGGGCTSAGGTRGTPVAWLLMTGWLAMMSRRHRRPRGIICRRSHVVAAPFSMRPRTCTASTRSWPRGGR